MTIGIYILHCNINGSNLDKHDIEEIRKSVNNNLNIINILHRYITFADRQIDDTNV